MSKGTYVLVFALDASATVRVGALGELRFAVGAYAYVGSALGPGGLSARIGRHRRTAKRRHWHIDYFHPPARLVETWQMVEEARLECIWAQTFIAAGAAVPAVGFGASDCACAAHLFYFSSLAALRAVRPLLGDPSVFCAEG